MPFSTIFIASDHGGFNLKQAVTEHLAARGSLVEDLGPERAESCDYPPYAQELCRRVLNTGNAMGILVCGTGLGMSMAANRISGIRAALCYNEFAARMARAHNDANVLCLGERVMGVGLATGVVDAFLDGIFEGGRHLRRITLVDAAGDAPDATS